MRTTAILSLIGYGAWNQLPDYGKTIVVLCAIALLGNGIISIGKPIFWISKNLLINPTLFLIGKAKKRKSSLAYLRKENEHLRQERQNDIRIFNELKNRLGLLENESLYDEVVNLINAKHEAASLRKTIENTNKELNEKKIHINNLEEELHQTIKNYKFKSELVLKYEDIIAEIRIALNKWNTSNESLVNEITILKEEKYNTKHLLNEANKEIERKITSLKEMVKEKERIEKHLNEYNTIESVEGIKNIIKWKEKYFDILTEIQNTLETTIAFDKLPETIKKLKEEINKIPEYNKDNYELFRELADIIKVPAGCQIIPWSKQRITELEKIEEQNNKKHKYKYHLLTVSKMINTNK